MKTAIACFLSACAGTLFTLWLIDHPVASTTAELRADGPDFASPSTDLPGNTEESSAYLAPRPAELPKIDRELGEAEETAIAVYSKANKAVVNISTFNARRNIFGEIVESENSTGSGTVLSDEGHILTNFHVIEDAARIEITLAGGESFEAEVIGADSLNDLAVLKIDPQDVVMTPIEFADSSRLLVGMQVFAIGNPFGLERTMTTGIISSLNRAIPVANHRSIRSIIQTDAAVNPGNSGGPLLDREGKLIGINVAIASQTGQSAGVGFAIPVNLVRRVAEMLLKHGRFIRPDTGIRRIFEVDKGILIEELAADGPAKQAGLRGPTIERRERGPYVVVRKDRSTADLIVAVDGIRVKTADDFLTYVESKAAGDEIVLVIRRDGKELEVPIELVAGQ